MNEPDEHIRDHYQSISLDDRRTQAILDSGKQISSAHRVKRLSYAAMAAAAVFVAALFLASPKDNASISDIVSEEVATNHLKSLKPDFATSDYQELQNGLSKLDFSIVPSQDFLLDKFILLGGRYCTLCGDIAAQLKLRDKNSGEECTLYITRLDKRLDRIKDDTAVYDGVHVQMWKTDDRFFALSRTEVAAL